MYNYGLFQPAGDGRDAKFLDEERALQDYSQSFEKGVPYLEVSSDNNAQESVIRGLKLELLIT